MFEQLKRIAQIRKFSALVKSGFPAMFENDVDFVLHLMSKDIVGLCGELSTYDQLCIFCLPENKQISFPYRIYVKDVYDDISHQMTAVQQTIYHCIFSRSYDGFVREKHIHAILDQKDVEWTYPYILKLSDEYVVEIVELIYRKRKNRNNEELKEFCKKNVQNFVYGYCRMISYWDCFYRNDCYHFYDYVGRKLYHECFGYTKSMNKAFVGKKKRHSSPS